MAPSPVLLAGLPAGLVWQADRLARPAAAGLPTGFAALDAELPGGGWPRSALTELLLDTPGIGELQLLMPLMRAVADERWIAWIDPPCLPYAPALAAAGLALERLLLIRPASPRETQWAVRQALASGACSMVLAWTPRIDSAALRRFQLAAEEAGTPLFLHRPLHAARQPSPAALRLGLRADGERLRVDILKRRGPVAAAPVHLPIRPSANDEPADEPIADTVVRADFRRTAAAGLQPRRA